MTLNGRGQGSVPSTTTTPKLCSHVWVLSVYPELAHEVTALLSGWGLEARTMWLPSEEKSLVIKRGHRAVNTL